MILPLRILLTAGAFCLPLPILLGQPDSPEKPVASTDSSASTAPSVPAGSLAPESSAPANPAAPQPIVPTVVEADHAEMVTGDTYPGIYLGGGEPVAWDYDPFDDEGGIIEVSL